MARYSDAVEWVALNDAPADTIGLEFNEAVEQLSSNITICFIADIWNKESNEIAKDVLKIRTKHFG